MNNESLQVGDFIEIPAWRTWGMVMEIQDPMPGTKEIEVLLQEDPDQPARLWRNYRLQPDEFTIVG